MAEIKYAVISKAAWATLYASEYASDFGGLNVGDTFTMDTGPTPDDPAPRDTRVTHFSAQKYDEDWPLEGWDDPLAGFIDWLKGQMAGIPKAFRASAKIKIDSTSGYEDSHYPSIEITYTRPETPEEIAARIAAHVEQIERRKQAKRAEYERLKAEFEG